MKEKTQAKHAGGNWSIGKSYGAIVTDEPYEGGVRGYDHPEHMKVYGGYLIAESVSKCNRPVIAAAADMYKALVQARETLEIAIRSALEGFSKDEEDAAVQEHVTIKAMDKALAKARGESL